MKKKLALLLSAMMIVSGCIMPALAATVAVETTVQSMDEDLDRRAEYISAYFGEPPVGAERDYNKRETVRRGNVKWDGAAADFTAFAFAVIAFKPFGFSEEDIFSIGTHYMDQVQTAIEEYAPNSNAMDYEDTIYIYDEVSTSTSEYLKHEVIYTLETGEELDPIVFYEVRSWV